LFGIAFQREINQILIFFNLKYIFICFRIILIYWYKKLFKKNIKNYFDVFLNKKYFEKQCYDIFKQPLYNSIYITVLNSSCNVDWFIILVKGNEKEISNKCPNMNLSDSNCRKKERKKEKSFFQIPNAFLRPGCFQPSIRGSTPKTKKGFVFHTDFTLPCPYFLSQNFLERPNVDITCPNCQSQANKWRKQQSLRLPPWQVQRNGKSVFQL